MKKELKKLETKWGYFTPNMKIFSKFMNDWYKNHSVVDGPDVFNYRLWLIMNT